MLSLLVEESKIISTLRNEVTTSGCGACPLWSRVYKDQTLHHRLSDVWLQGAHIKDFQDTFADHHSDEMVWKGLTNTYCRQHVHDLQEGASPSWEGEGLRVWSFSPFSGTEEWQRRLFKSSDCSGDFELSEWIICWELKIAKPITIPDFVTVLTNYLTIYNWPIIYTLWRILRKPLQCIFSWTQKLLSPLYWKAVRTQMSACNNFN